MMKMQVFILSNKLYLGGWGWMAAGAKKIEVAGKNMKKEKTA